MKLYEIIQNLENWAPLSDAEGFDNVGLLTGNTNDELHKALVTLDITEEVMQEAIEHKADLIISFHPLIFNGLKRLSGGSRVEELIVKAIQNKIAIYAIHTNLDAQWDGVNAKICERLGLQNRQILIPRQNNLFKLIFFVPNNKADEVKEAIWRTGAGTIGNYAECSFNIQGQGTFKPIKNANPSIGELNRRQHEPELKVEILIEKHQINQVLFALKTNHPYEEVAYDLIPLFNHNQTKGMGQIGELQEEMSELEFLKWVKTRLKTQCVRHSAIMGKKIKKVAVLGGSGAFAINAARRAGADAYVTADLKYHDFFEAENQILLCDPGHYESEQFTKNLITDYISENFPNFAVLKSQVDTNPINYLI
ncbi:MAG: Nif3-like dinuclear metal center hexameric protein [Flavobacteriaceae bacterium]|nr:Nif3-like dinuclear metal center hexameric protein [Flavobacteriaceae bacterium]